MVWERTPGRDSENPDASLRGRPTLGIPILLGMRQRHRAACRRAADGLARSDLQFPNGKTYDASIKPVDADTLHLEGCVLGGLFCGGQNWTRVKPSAASATARATGEVCSRVSDLARRTH